MCDPVDFGTKMKLELAADKDVLFPISRVADRMGE